MQKPQQKRPFCWGQSLENFTVMLHSAKTEALGLPLLRSWLNLHKGT